MHLLWGSISKKNITLRLLSWRKQWDRAAVLCDLAPLWWAHLTVCVRERERTALLYTPAFTPDKLHSHLIRTQHARSCTVVSSSCTFIYKFIRQREFVHPDCIFLACLVLSENNTKMKARREGKGDRESDTDAYLMFYALYLEDETEKMHRLFVVLLHTNHIHEYFLTTRPPSFKETPLTAHWCREPDIACVFVCVKGKDSLVSKPQSVTHTSAYL